MPIRRVFLLSFVLILMGPSIFLTLPAPGKNSNVKITSSTELVLVPAVVTEKSGEHITGLKGEDFQVLENGVEQKLATFEEITTDTHLWTRPSRPNEFTNSATGGVARGRITMIVLDFINTAFSDQAYARGELIKYLIRSTDQQEPTALFSLTRSGLHVIHDFTADPHILLAALHKVAGDTVPGAGAALDPQSVELEAARINGTIRNNEGGLESYEQYVAIEDTLQAMQFLAQAYRGYPVRKSVIWITGGFPFTVRGDTMLPGPGNFSLSDVESDYERTWQLMNDAQMALYPVEAGGLMGMQGLSAAMPYQGLSNPSGANRSPNLATPNPGTSLVFASTATLQDVHFTFTTFASMTGGRAFINRNDLDEGFRRAASDSAQYYMLGYYLDRSKKKEGWMRLTVKVQREHATVRARNGFFLTKATTDPDADHDRDVKMALSSPFEYSGLALTARWGNVESGSAAGKKHIGYTVHIDPDPGLFTGIDNNHVKLEFLALVKSPEGKKVGDLVIRRVDGHTSSEQIAAFQKQGLDGEGGLDLAGGEYTVRFVVRDGLSGRIGAVDAPLKVD